MSSLWPRIATSRIAPAIVLAIVSAFVAMRLGYNGPWFDESYTVLLVAPHDFHRILELTAVDSHPPLWYWLVKAWTLVFGDSLVAFRGFSAACMIGALALWYELLRIRFSPRVALLALVLVAFNPMVFRYAFEARMYPWGILLTVGSTWLVVSPRTRGRTIAYWLCAVAMLYTHYFLMFIVAAQLLWLLIRRREQGVVAWQVVAFGASILVAFLPWIPVLLSRAEHTVKHGFWIGPFTPNSLVGYLTEVFLRRSDWDLAGWRAVLALGWFAAFGIALHAAARAPRTLVLWCLACVPPALLILISIKTPLFYPRYVIYGLFALCTLLAIGAGALPGWRRIAVVAVLVIGTISGFRRELPRSSFRMNLVDSLVSQPRDGELPTVVVVHYFAALDARVALSRPERVVELRSAPPQFAIHEALYQPSWYILDLSQVKTRHVWTIEDSGHGWHDAPPHWRLLETHRRGYVRAQLWVQDLAVSLPSPP